MVTAGYRFVRVLGRGSRAVVWEAVSEATGTHVALKVLDAPASGAAERLQREFAAQRSLQHDNVVAAYELLEVEGRLAIVAELVEGPDLRAWIESHRPTRERALRMFGGILRGLAAAHAAGLVHRDLKPANVLIAGGRRPVPKITDFGVVKTEQDVINPTLVLGTLRYMAPEQIRDPSRVDARADLFAAGCILYELLTGNRAFDAPNRVALMNAIRLKQHGPIPYDLEPRVRRVLESLLATDADDRPASAEVVLDALGLPREVEEPIEIGPVNAPSGGVPLAGLLAAVVVALLALALFFALN